MCPEMHRSPPTTHRATYSERFATAVSLRRFLNHNEAMMEDTYGYSPAMYNSVISHFIANGIPNDADEQNRLNELVRETFQV